MDENVNGRGKTAAISWATASSYSINATFLTPDISSILEQVQLLDGWNGIIGVILTPIGLGVTNNEMINFWSYDHGNLEHTPKLYIEWEDTPYFSDIPTDLTINNETLGYHIEWTALDGNPTNYTIIGNETIGESTKQVQNGTWQSNVEIRYDIPKINISSYISVIVNYTIYIRDADGNFESDTVLVTVTDKKLTVIEIKLVQDGKTFSRLDRDYFLTGKGPFTLQIYNSTPFSPTVKLTALYPENQLEFWTTVTIIGNEALAQTYF